MRFVIPVLLLFLLACKGNPQPQVNEIDKKDSAVAVDSTKEVSHNKFEGFDQAHYKIHTQKTVGNYRVSLWEGLSGQISPPFLVITDTLTHKKDTLALNQISDLQDREAGIEDITKSVGFPQLTLCLSWQGESDNTYSEVVGYRQDTLKELFSIPSAGGISDTLKRKDRWTLEGHVFERDDIVSLGHDNYLIRVSLKDSSVKIYPPDTVSIDYESKATESIHAYRILPSGKQTPYTILPNTPLHIDTIYYKQHVVSLHLNDSIRLRAKHHEIELKVQGDSAG